MHDSSGKDIFIPLIELKTRSQVSTPCYTAKQDSVVNEDDNHSQSTPSPSKTDFEQPEPPIDYQLMVIKKDQLRPFGYKSKNRLGYY